MRSASIVLASLVLLAACSPASPAPAMPAVAPTAGPRPPDFDVILATTTSTQDSGLLDVLVPLFDAQTGYRLKVIAVGTGQALQMGREGNADVLLVHAPASEKAFMEGGFGTDRFLVMHNDFVFVGPASDPAAIKGGSDAVVALTKIYESAAPFVSRGDKSGTHSKEMALWRSAGLDVATSRPSWYMESGQGMGATLIIASEKSAYTLTDRATYLATKTNLQLDLLVEKDNALLNVYHVMTVSADKWPKANYLGAISFAHWLLEPAVQDLIAEFGVDEFGEPLFVPDADKTDADLGL
ncbi:MAG: substrate-binding domain-containing protein [Chloroflexota bacterium]